MNRKLVFLLSAALSIAVGCRGCGGGNGDGDGGWDGGGDGGIDGGRSDGGKGDGGQGGGDGGTTGGIDQGGFTLDGGAPGNPGGSGVRVTPEGTIKLDSKDTQLHFAWIANSSQGWVSKYDTVNNKEVGRYYSVLPVGTLRPSGANSPSRTAVDLNGDVWVANRAPGIQGSVTKIINDPAFCPDRNGNGKIDTSRDLDGDGVIADAGEFIVPSNPDDIKTYDECVWVTTPVGNNGTGVHARGLAVSFTLEGSAGDVWVGLHEEKRVMRLSSATGEVLPANADGGTWIDLPFGPYGLAVDGRQRLWVAAAPSNVSKTTLAAIDTMTGTVIDPLIQVPDSFAPSSMYGIAVDGKNRVWLGAWSGGAYVYRYERPDNSGAGTWARFYVGDLVSQGGTHVGRTRGITVDEDGVVWVSSDRQESTSGPSASQLVAIHGDDGGVRPFVTDAGQVIQVLDLTDSNTRDAIGVGLDVEGNVWINNFSGNVVKVHRDNGSFIRLPRQPGNLYTYSDFTGYQLRHFTAPQGTFRYTLTGCDTDTIWDKVVWDAVTPPNTAVRLYVKAANDPASFNDPALTRYGPYPASPAQLQDGGMPPVPKSKYLRLEFVLSTTDNRTSPELRSFKGYWSCPVIIK